MNRDLPSAVLLLGLFLLVGGLSYWTGWRVGHKSVFVPADKPDTVTVTKWIPAPITEPETKPILPKVFFLPVHDTLAVHDTTAVRDSVLVEVPMEEKTYTGEDYRATIRGFQPELTDIWVRHKETVITQLYRKRWSFTVGPQVGVGYTPQGLQPYAGAGITFGYSF